MGRYHDAVPYFEFVQGCCIEGLEECGKSAGVRISNASLSHIMFAELYLYEHETEQAWRSRQRAWQLKPHSKVEVVFACYLQQLGKPERALE